MNTHNIHFFGGLAKIIIQLLSNILLICSSAIMLKMLPRSNNITHSGLPGHKHFTLDTHESFKSHASKKLSETNHSKLKNYRTFS